mmetsp:Transcript_72468/g.135390  ORF Transcript_72468/g.135390 Transcript_72468/m.135390 type:complete len:238 (-) Transcript_72468:15-728(-)
MPIVVDYEERSEASGDDQSAGNHNCWAFPQGLVKPWLSAVATVLSTLPFVRLTFCQHGHRGLTHQVSADSFIHLEYKCQGDRVYDHVLNVTGLHQVCHPNFSSDSPHQHLRQEHDKSVDDLPLLWHACYPHSDLCILICITSWRCDERVWTLNEPRLRGSWHRIDKKRHVNYQAELTHHLNHENEAAKPTNVLAFCTVLSGVNGALNLLFPIWEKLLERVLDILPRAPDIKVVEALG